MEKKTKNPAKIKTDFEHQKNGVATFATFATFATDATNATK
jgi:hypothetical protein